MTATKCGRCGDACDASTTTATEASTMPHRRVDIRRCSGVCRCCVVGGDVDDTDDGNDDVCDVTGQNAMRAVDSMMRAAALTTSRLLLWSVRLRFPVGMPTEMRGGGRRRRIHVQSENGAHLTNCISTECEH